MSPFLFPCLLLILSRSLPHIHTEYRPRIQVHAHPCHSSLCPKNHDANRLSDLRRVLTAKKTNRRKIILECDPKSIQSTKRAHPDQKNYFTASLECPHTHSLQTFLILVSLES
ncbi:hypothetical protein BKA57DRAFT_457690 [Linnemannia elongata]|nr:hypothetical protein BKA57DRAFT_457690 [Linnemannia elongata]